MKTVLLAAVAVLALSSGVLSSTAHAQREARITGQKLVDLCRSTDRTALEACTAYIDGIADTVGFYQRLRPADGSKGGKLPAYICIPAATTGAQMRDTVINWFKAHPDRATQQASGIVLNALNTTYLCPGERPSADAPPAPPEPPK